MARLVFNCNHCGQRLSAGALTPGDAMTCPNCRTEQPVPRADTSALASAPAPDPVAAPPAPVDMPYAGLWPRALAWSLDLIVLSCVGGLVGVLVGPVAAVPLEAGPNDPKMVLLQVIGTLINWIYFAGMESSRWQATLGKTAVGIRVTDMHGKRVTFVRASARHFTKILSVLTLGIGFLMIALTQRRQALHDMVAGCLVVRSR